MITFAPSAASLRAKASPIPYDAPVTSAVLPVHSDIAISFELAPRAVASK
jgi:hypothetical protein